MQLTPHYGDDPLITIDGPPTAILEPAIRQRERLADTVTAFDDEQWAHASRCDGWSSRDVIVHLDTTNGFWAASIAAGLRHEPTRILATFDPVATPAQLVAGAGDLTADEVLNRFLASTRALTDLLASLDDAACSMTAEAPPGHLSISAVAHHALWDAWVHERDIMLPLGLASTEEADEIAGCLRYAAALSPAFAVANGTAEQGELALTVTDPDLSIVVEIADHVRVRSGTGKADATLTGDAVQLVEALSIRRPLEHEIPTEARWMVRGLSEVFDRAPD